MIDNIHIEAKTSPIYEFPNRPFEWLGLMFTPVYKRGINHIEKCETDYNGLRVELYFDKLKITGSIHKFCKGNNYSEFSRKEINNTIDEMVSRFEIEASNWEIKKLEFGFNLSMPNPANEYILLAQSYKNVGFDKMKYKNKCYGKKCFMSEYAIKIYDKHYQTKMTDRITIPTNILRIEFCYGNKRKLPQEVKSLADLKNENGVRTLYKDFESAIMKIEFAEKVDLTNSTEEERKLFFASQDVQYLKVEKELNKSRLSTIKANIKEVKASYLKKEFNATLSKAIKNKYIDLYCC